MQSGQERLDPIGSIPDYRSEFQRDVDKILYCPEFRRLSGVTQVASATEGDIFHNRLTHSLKVAQVGRRLAERLIADLDPDQKGEVTLNPDVVEAAGLAHDLGHPPFGHEGEEAICEAMREETIGGVEGDLEGFEGNAQTFRIVTRLAAPETPRGRGFGLNLTRSTLNAILKYPWLSCDRGERKKWGAYQSEEEVFRQVRRQFFEGEQLSLEAKLMDWADDVTYAVHDLDDFYRAGLIPLHRLHTGGIFQGTATRTPELEFFMAEIDNTSVPDAEVLASLLHKSYSFLNAPYRGSGQQREALRASTSLLLTSFINAVTLEGNPPEVVICPERHREVDLLKQLTMYYVIRHPRVVGVREGQRRMLKKLFDIYVEVISRSQERSQERLQALLPQSTIDRLHSGDTVKRLAADLLAGMTERQVIQTYHRLNGMAPGPLAHFDL